jgi:hypothetical protein
VGPGPRLRRGGQCFWTVSVWCVAVSHPPACAVEQSLQQFVGTSGRRRVAVRVAMHSKTRLLAARKVVIVASIFVVGAVLGARGGVDVVQSVDAATGSGGRRVGDGIRGGSRLGVVLRLFSLFGLVLEPDVDGCSDVPLSHLEVLNGLIAGRAGGVHEGGDSGLAVGGEGSHLGTGWCQTMGKHGMLRRVSVVHNGPGSHAVATAAAHTAPSTEDIEAGERLEARTQKRTDARARHTSRVRGEIGRWWGERRRWLRVGGF